LNRLLFVTLLTTTVLSGLTSIAAQQKQSFGKTKDGTEVFVYTLKNKNGMETQITNFGGVMLSLKVPDRDGKFDDVVLGFDKLADYEKQGPYFGAIIGRYANRIAGGKFKLEGKEYQVTVNDPPNMLHGGKIGFDKKVWEVKQADDHSLQLHYVSKDGEEGFPGNLSTDVTYTLTDANDLKIDYAAATDKSTVLNLTSHSYFNLKGQGEGEITDHQVQLNADRFTPGDDHLIPTGKLAPVAGTPMEFRKLTEISKHIGDPDPLLKVAIGYDFNYVINRTGSGVVKAARVVEPKSGRVMEVLTTEPGIQFYTGNHMDNGMKGKGGKTYNFRYGLCLETQHYPDSPNHPNFPSTELKPGQKFSSTTIYRFSTDKVASKTGKKHPK
jgi:aldose 1-epimerase